MIILGSRSSATNSEVSTGTRNPIEFSFQDSTISTFHSIGFSGKSKSTISGRKGKVEKITGEEAAQIFFDWS